MGCCETAIGKRVKRLVLFGAAKEMIAKTLGALTETVIVETCEAAVRDAHRTRATGRRGFAVARMLEFRHVSQLCRAGKSF